MTLHRDQQATIVSLFDELADGVYTLAARLLRDRHLAEDVVQETFLAAFRNLGSYRGEGPISAWIYRIGYRKSIEVQRRRRDEPQDPDVLARSTTRLAPSAEQEVIRAELIATLDRAIDGLTQPLRAVFVLRDIEGITTSDAATALAISESAVKMRLLRARKELRKSLQEYL
ncbi:MAG: RNA polymerase sigma factor [Acidimicrobiia bacterium]|nr:RNA polymerase sigma factor [Acidimicrobiia bacterium]